MAPKLLSVTEIAARLGIDPSLVRVYCREGRIKGEKMGRDWFASEAALARFEKTRRGRGRPPTKPQ
jgi:predicted site-specific integrase-resolvase